MISHREEPVCREIFLLLLPAQLYQLDSNGRKRRCRSRADVEMNVKPNEDSWPNGKPSYRPHVKPFVNICTVYVEKRQLVSSTNIAMILIKCVCVYVYQWGIETIENPKIEN